MEKAKIITVTSAKGGSGKTTTVLNLAGILSLQQKKVLIIDLDFYAGSIAFSLNLPDTQDIYKMLDDLNNNRFTSVDHYLSSYNDYIDILSSPKDPRDASKISSKYIHIVLSKVLHRYDIILIDTNHFLNDINLVALDSSDYILYVINNTPSDLKNMATRIAIHQDIEQENYKIILNEASSKENLFSKKDIENIIKHTIDYTIPKSFWIKSIDQYTLNGTILTLDKNLMKKHKQTMKQFQKIGEFLEK